MPAPVSLRLTSARSSVRRFVRRRRRPLAAALAGTGLLLALVSLRAGPPSAAPAGTTAGLPGLRAGEVAVPVVFASGGLVSVIDVGDVIDLVAVGDRDAEAGSASVVAPAARVVEIPSAGSGLAGSSAAVVVVAVRAADALPLSAASVTETLTVVIRSP